MGGATQAGVEAANPRLDSVQHPFGDLVVVDVVLGNLGHRFVHCQVVVAGGNNQVDLLNQTILVHLVMVEQGTSRRFADADALELVNPSLRSHPIGYDIRIVHEILDALQASEDFQQTSVVVEEGGGGNPIGSLSELLQLAIRFIGTKAGANIHPRQGADAIDAVGIAQGFVIGKLEIRPFLHRLANEVAVVILAQTIRNNLALAIGEAQLAVVVLPKAVFAHQPEEQGRKFTKNIHLFP